MSWLLLASMVVVTTGVLLGALIGYLITRCPPRGYPSGDKQVRDLRPPPLGLQSPKPRPRLPDPYRRRK
jgi:hypothetical protein